MQAEGISEADKPAKMLCYRNSEDFHWKFSVDDGVQVQGAAAKLRAVTYTAYVVYNYHQQGLAALANEILKAERGT